MRQIVLPRRRLIGTIAAYGTANIIGCGRSDFGQSMTSPASIGNTVKAAVGSPPGHGWSTAHNDVGALSIESLQGRTINVANADQLTSALAVAQPGHHVVLANGTYSGSFVLTVNSTKLNPIVIRSANPYMAIIDGSIELSGSWGIVSQLKAKGITATGNDCRISRSYVGSGGIYVAKGNRVTIDYNEIRNYSHRGIWCRPSASINEMMNVWIHHNYIKDGTDSPNTTALNFTGGAWEATPKIHNALVEYNLAEGCFSTTTIGTKCSGNTYRYNTCRDNAAGFASRHGHSNTWIGNSCINSNGYQICGKGHRIIGNYTDAPSQNWRDIGLFWGNTTSDSFLQWISEGRDNSPYERAENCFVAGNIGPLRVGAGSSSWGIAALNNEIRAHSGKVVFVSGRHSNTIDRRNNRPNAETEVPPYVVLHPADVGPDAA